MRNSRHLKETKTFQSYNFVTGAVDGTLAYDFDLYAAPERAERRPRRKTLLKSQEWVREKVRDDAYAGARSNSVSPVAVVSVLCVIVLIVMMLLAQIQLVNVSTRSAALESRITELRSERDKLIAAYETTFNLKSVEEYAVNELGMQTPDEDQIYYLTNVSSADKAVIITSDTSSVSFGLEDILASLRAYKAYFD